MLVMKIVWCYIVHFIQVYDVSHKEKVTGMVKGLGANFSCSGDKTIKIWEPTRDPEPIASLEVHTKEVAKVSSGL